MAERCGSKKCTRADAAIVAAVCLFLVILVPVLFARPREQSVRRLCAANLAQIGKAMLLYAGENEGAFPRAGEPNTVWGTTMNWMATDRRTAFGITADGSGGTASINASFYLLVKYEGLSPRVFVCRGDKGTTAFDLSKRTDVPGTYEPEDAWDFGDTTESYKHCSYAYHIPYSQYALMTSRDPNLAVAADRNPWIASPAALASTFALFLPGRDAPGGTARDEVARMGNSITHQRDGQNVLFRDGRVTFEKRSYCGVGQDNIYTVSRLPGTGDCYGVQPVVAPVVGAANDKDSLLVHDPPIVARGPDRKRR